MEVRFDSKKHRARPQAKMHTPDKRRKRVSFRPAELRRAGERRDTPLETGSERPQVRQTGGISKSLMRIAAIFAFFVFAGMLLFVLSGYEQITRAYQEINSINSAIEQTKLDINALDVAIECAVTIEQAQAWAIAHNMRYPLQSQYIASGSSIPVTEPPTAIQPTAGGEAGSLPASGENTQTPEDTQNGDDFAQFP